MSGRAVAGSDGFTTSTPSGAPLVTIVTPTFRMANFLETAIRSVANQDYPHVEHIVVDGGDDPETPALLERYRDVVARYIREPDGGQSDAINKGFRAARGELVAWVNADDYYFPDAVSRAVRAFTETPDLDLFYGDVVYVDREGQFLRYFTEVEPPDLDRIRTNGDYICQPSTFFAKRTLDRIGLLDERLHFTMDWELWCRMARHGCRFHYEHAPIAVNREYAETKTMGGGWPRVRELLQTNWRYKTGPVPWGFVRMAEAEVPRAFAPIGWALRMMEPVRWAKRAFVPKAPISPLYGFYAHSPQACQEARVAVPLASEPPEWFEATIALPPGLARQRIAVAANGEALDEVVLEAGSRPSATARIGLDPARTGTRLDVTLRAEVLHRIGGREVCFELRGFRLSTPM